MRPAPQFVVDYLCEIETLVSPARHLPADRPGVITGGYGETSPDLVHEGMIVSKELASEWLHNRLSKIGARIERLFPAVELTDGQYGALISFEYNLGVLGANGCSVSRHLRARNYKAAGDAFLLYDMANGKHLRGLKNRRRLERSWFLDIPYEPED